MSLRTRFDRLRGCALGVVLLIAVFDLAAEGAVATSELTAGTERATWDEWLRLVGAGGEEAASTLLYDASVEPGDVLRLVVAAGRVPERVELRSADRTVTSSGRIPVRMTGVVALNVYLLGVDSTVDPGRYLLAGRSADGETLFERELEVLPRAFRREEIPLDSNLTALRSEPDPRKTEQTRILSDLILSRDPGALYHAGPLEWPLPPDTRRTSLFGDRRTFVYTDGRRAGAIHVGLDFAAPVGTPIVSSGTGVVRMARDRIVTGNTVVIEHLPGVYSMYYHLDEIDVEEGVLVATGQPIGTVGATGLATGPHLHWEIRVGGVPVSPERVMNQPLLLGALTP